MSNAVILLARDMVVNQRLRPSVVADQLGVSRSNLSYWSRKYGWTEVPKSRHLEAEERRVPVFWRCCGLLQAIDPDSPPVCRRCGETPMWARPEPDLRHLTSR